MVAWKMCGLWWLWIETDWFLLFKEWSDLLQGRFLQVRNRLWTFWSARKSPIFALFSRRFAPRCSGCFGILQHDDMIRRAKDHFFHIDCFVCVVCSRQLKTGDKFFIINGHLFICQEDYQHLHHDQNQSAVEGKLSISKLQFLDVTNIIKMHKAPSGHKIWVFLSVCAWWWTFLYYYTCGSIMTLSGCKK